MHRRPMEVNISDKEESDDEAVLLSSVDKMLPGVALSFSHAAYPKPR